jgi:hypothetical protein
LPHSQLTIALLIDDSQLPIGNPSTIANREYGNV